MTRTIKHLVLSGAELKGIAYIGLWKALEEQGISSTLETIVGASIGSMFGLSFCLQYTAKQMEQLILNLNIMDLKHIDYNRVFSFFELYGLDSGTNFERLFKIVIQKKLGSSDATFADLHAKYPKPMFKVIGTNLSTESEELYSFETTPNMPLWKALRISACFPIYFQPVYHDEHVYVDGGLVNNYPISHVLHDLDHTLGVVVEYTKEQTDKKIEGFDQYMLKLLRCMNNAQQRYLESQFAKQTLCIRVGYSIFDFDFGNTVKQELIDSGYIQSKSWLEQTEQELTPRKSSPFPTPIAKSTSSIDLLESSGILDDDESFSRDV